MSSQALVSDTFFLSGERLDRPRQVQKVAGHQARVAQHGGYGRHVEDALAEIDSIGVQVKDLDMGLLDFPCEVEGQTILLCWKLGEKSITHWHGTNEGFAGRKPIDQRIARAKKVN